MAIVSFTKRNYSKEGAGSGGDYAVPIARRIFDAYFSEKQ